jgi:hypothetical protein
VHAKVVDDAGASARCGWHVAPIDPASCKCNHNTQPAAIATCSPPQQQGIHKVSVQLQCLSSHPYHSVVSKQIRMQIASAVPSTLEHADPTKLL